MRLLFISHRENVPKNYITTPPPALLHQEKNTSQHLYRDRSWSLAIVGPTEIWVRMLVRAALNRTRADHQGFFSPATLPFPCNLILSLTPRQQQAHVLDHNMSITPTEISLATFNEVEACPNTKSQASISLPNCTGYCQIQIIIILSHGWYEHKASECLLLYLRGHSIMMFAFSSHWILLLILFTLVLATWAHLEDIE